MANEGFETPILFLVFNRPDTTRQVFERIRLTRPKRLFIASDGPRNSRPGEEDLCNEVKAIVTRIDWDCELKTLFREVNLGCRLAISGAIVWFFENVEEGIILEDDCLPHPGFFRFCAELLEKYRDDNRVMQIVGTNSFRGWQRDMDYSYYFSFLGQIWGWATWRRAWELNDIDMKAYAEIRTKGYLADSCTTEEELRLRLENFDSVHSGRMATCWGHQWKYSMMVNHGLSVIPSVNLITNIGFGSQATHTKTKHVSSYPLGNLEFPLKHPPFMIRDVISDTRQAETDTRLTKLKRALKHWLVLIGLRKSPLVRTYLIQRKRV